MAQCCINPSILSADFVNLEAELRRISNADAVHVDVMDNHFVPNLTIGLPVVQRIQAVSPVPLDAHLMIADADRWAPGFADAGIASVTFHAEASIAPIKLARELRARGAKAGMALRPGTAVEPYLDMLPELDLLLIMTVEPGFGGQSFLDLTLPKIRRARAAIDGVRGRGGTAGGWRHHRGDDRARGRGGGERLCCGVSRLRRRGSGGGCRKAPGGGVPLTRGPGRELLRR